MPRREAFKKSKQTSMSDLFSLSVTSNVPKPEMTVVRLPEFNYYDYASYYDKCCAVLQAQSEVLALRCQLCPQSFSSPLLHTGRCVETATYDVCVIASAAGVRDVGAACAVLSDAGHAPPGGQEARDGAGNVAPARVM